MAKNETHAEKPCATCGTCPTCGSRPAARVYPSAYYPWTHPWPYITWGQTTPYTFTVTNGTAVSSYDGPVASSTARIDPSQHMTYTSSN
jgi:hypothetical protein